MGSFGNSANPWANSYDSCSQGVCSIYCPQWCYLVFPPPPPIPDDDANSAGNSSPIIISVIGILITAFVLLSYYTLVYNKSTTTTTTGEEEINSNNNNKIIKAYKYRKKETKKKKSSDNNGGGGEDCAVCLSEFDDGEDLRRLPLCGHAFHADCIDAWLDSHATCPLCRSDVVANDKLVAWSSEPVVVVVVVDVAEEEEAIEEPKSPISSPNRDLEVL